MRLEGPPANEEVRAKLRAEPNELLHRRLTVADPAAAARIHVNDQKRLVRALEVYELTGQPISSFQTEWAEQRERHAAMWVGLDWDKDALNRRIGVNLPPPTDEEKAKWILNYTRAMQQETAELIDSVPWKWWAKYQKFDEQNAKVEVVDLFHFLVSLAQTPGMSADDVYQAYLKKNQVNHQRQDSGYAKKDEADSKHI